MTGATFTSLGLHAEFSNACVEAGYAEPSPIQVEAIPPLLRGRDRLLQRLQFAHAGRHLDLGDGGRRVARAQEGHDLVRPGRGTCQGSVP